MQPEKTRILFWSSKFNSPVGGAEIWAGHYVRAMHHRGYRIEVIVAEEEDQNYVSTDGANPFPVHSLHVARALRSADPREFITCVRKAAAIESAFSPHLLHVSIGLSAPMPLLFIMSRGLIGRMSASNIPNPANLMSLHHEWNDQFAASDSPYKRILQQMDWVCCFSQSTLRRMRSQSSLLAPALVHHSSMIAHAILHVDDNLVSTDTRSDLLPTIAFIGRLSREKGADLALRAFSLLRSTFPLLRMIIVGEGPEHSSLNALAEELDVADAVIFTGWLTAAEVRSTLRASSLLLVPSREESFGLVILEAAHEVCPVVATSIGGLPEVCLDEETGLLCPPENPTALAAAAARLLSNPDFARNLALAANARLNVHQGWDTHVDHYAALTQRLIAERIVDPEPAAKDSKTPVAL
jgi:glycosyltransferase involved in cell wall biosynthesis